MGVHQGLRRRDPTFRKDEGKVFESTCKGAEGVTTPFVRGRGSRGRHTGGRSGRRVLGAPGSWWGRVPVVFLISSTLPPGPWVVRPNLGSRRKQVFPRAPVRLGLSS